MEHIDALEAVRRLTLERDALAQQVAYLTIQAADRERLAEQVRRLSGDLFVETYKPRRDAPQAPERPEQPETGAEPTEGLNGAPRGCEVPLCACCKRPVLRAVFCDACESRAADRIEQGHQDFRKTLIEWARLIKGRPETTTEPQTCEGCKHGRHSLCDKMVCTRHAPKHGERMGERGFWPLVSREDTCGDWEARR